MSPKMEKVMVLVRKAESDYKASLILLNDREHEGFYGVISFHCQQCIEKSLKAFLMLHEVRSPKTHDLGVLQELCAGVDETFKGFELVDISKFGVNVRYDEPSPGMEETQNAFETAGMVLEHVKERARQSMRETLPGMGAGCEPEGENKA